jgi:hypothetical protein
MGKGIYGAQAAAQYKVKTTAAKLSAGQCGTNSGNIAQSHTLRLSTPLPGHKEKARTDSTIDETGTQIPAK